MSQPVAHAFQVHPHDRHGAWESNDGRYRAYAHELLVDLESLCQQVMAAWPVDVGASISSAAADPDLIALTRRRDRASDTTRIYAAMAIEGFLNFYGVLRLGNSVYEDHFERLGIVPKIRQLLLVCDGLSVPKSHVLCARADAVAQSRNRLVHPKAQEVVGDPMSHVRSGTKVPEAARESVAAMESFFAEFIAAVPASRPHIERGSAA